MGKVSRLGNGIDNRPAVSEFVAMQSAPKKILLLGAGELGREVVISAKRLGHKVIAVDKYPGAPAMQLADGFEVIDMLNAEALEAVVKKHLPDYIVPEVEAIRTEKLREFEAQGTVVVPTAEAAHLTMNRDAIRDLAANELGLRTARFAYASSASELAQQASLIGYPVVVKPVMSSSGKGQSVVKSAKQIEGAWKFACEGMRGDKAKVIVEEFIDFKLEITLLTIKQHKGPTLFVAPIGHRQEKGDYRESWLPAKLPAPLLNRAKKMAKKLTDRLGGAGLFGVEFFITSKEVIFSEVSPRPHDTGMVTLISQNLSEFDLHVRAFLGLPIPSIQYHGASASAVVLADQDSEKVSYSGVEKALLLKSTDVRLFAKPSSRPFRRMGVALASASNVAAARKLAVRAAGLVRISYS